MEAIKPWSRYIPGYTGDWYDLGLLLDDYFTTADRVIKIAYRTFWTVRWALHRHILHISIIIVSNIFCYFFCRI